MEITNAHYSKYYGDYLENKLDEYYKINHQEKGLRMKKWLNIFIKDTSLLNKLINGKGEVSFYDCMSLENRDEFMSELKSVIEYGMDTVCFPFEHEILDKIFLCDDFEIIEYFLKDGLDGILYYSEKKGMFLHKVGLYFKLDSNYIREGIEILCDIGSDNWIDCYFKEKASAIAFSRCKKPRVGEFGLGVNAIYDRIYFNSNLFTQCIKNLCDNKNITDDEKKIFILELFNVKLGNISIDLEVFEIIDKYFSYEELRNLVKVSKRKNNFCIHNDRYGSGFNTEYREVFNPIVGNFGLLWYFNDGLNVNEVIKHIDKIEYYNNNPEELKKKLKKNKRVKLPFDIDDL